jgi:hypothetical protein
VDFIGADKKAAGLHAENKTRINSMGFIIINLNMVTNIISAKDTASSAQTNNFHMIFQRVWVYGIR